MTAASPDERQPTTQPTRHDTPTAPSPGGPSRAPHASIRSSAAWTALLFTVVLGLAFDLASKHIAFRTIADDPVRISRADVLALPDASHVGVLVPRHEPVTVVPYVLNFQLVLNPCAVFGVGPGQRWFFVLFTVAALAFALWMFARWTTPRDRLAHVAIGLVIAGGVGNLYDRLHFGCVRDFIHPLPGVRLPFGLTWPGGNPEVWPWVSNVADALLLVGIGVLMAKLWFAGARDEAAATSAREKPAERAHERSDTKR